MVSSELDAIYKSSQTDELLKSSKFVVARLLPRSRLYVDFGAVWMELAMHLAVMRPRLTS